MTERELQSAVLECAELLGWLCYHPRPARTADGWRTAAQGNGASGFPDVVMAHSKQRRLLFVELKSAAGRLRPEQTRWLDTLALAYCEMRVWRPADWLSGDIERCLRGVA